MSADVTESEPLEPRKTSLLKASTLMASGTMVSRVLGFLRSAMLVAAIGVTAGTAASFNLANTLPNLVYNMLAAGVLDAVLVPQIVRALRTRGGSPYVNKLITAVGSLLFLLTVIVLMATPLLIWVFAPTLEPATRALAITFTLWCVPQIFFYGLYNLFGQVLNARGVFGPYMWAPVANNLIAIAGLGVYLAIWGPAGQVLPAADFGAAQTAVLAGSATAGIIAQALVLVVPMKRSGVRLRLDFNLRGTSFGSAPKVAMWTFATLLVAQIGVISTTNLATRGDTWTDATGQVVAGLPAYQFAFMVFMLPQSLITVTIVTATFTSLADMVATGDHRGVRSAYMRGYRLVVSLCMASAAVLIVVATPLMQMLMPTFDTRSASLYGTVLVALILGVPSSGIVMISQRLFYARENARPVFMMALVPEAMQLIVGWTLYFLLDPKWWTVGAAGAETVARVLQGFIAIFMVARAQPLLRASTQIRLYFTYLGAFAVSATVGWGLLHVLGPGTSATGRIARFADAGWKTALVSALILLVYFGALRVIDPKGSGTLVKAAMARLKISKGSAGEPQASLEIDEVDEAEELPPPPPPPPAQMIRELPPQMNTGSDRRAQRKAPPGTFNPTVPALLVGVGVLVAGGWFVTENLRSDSTLVVVEQSAQSAMSGQSGKPGATEGGEGAASEAPVVSSVTVFSWGDDEGDHPELATAILDGDEGTSWRSRYFQESIYQQGAPVALLLNLANPAVVSQVTVDVIGSGGEVAVVDASDGDPRSDTVLATSTVDGKTVIKLEEPVEVSRLGLVFTSLPTDDEGKNRAKVVSISVE